MRNLTGKRTLITGAGHGLGQAMACVFANAGSHLIVTDREPKRVAETVDFLRRNGHQAVGFVMDVTDVESIRQIRDRIHADLGPVDILINNAGVVSGGNFQDVPWEKHVTTFNVNMLGAAAVTHVFLSDLVSRPEAHCVNIASASALIALPYAVTYAASKWAVLGFSESLREELRLEGHAHVGVTAVCPSYVGTGMFAGVRTPRLTGLLSPERLALVVLKAVQRDQESILTPWLVKLIPIGRGTMSRKWFRRLCDWLNVSNGMAGWKGHNELRPHTNRPITSKAPNVGSEAMQPLVAKGHRTPSHERERRRTDTAVPSRGVASSRVVPLSREEIP